jgi:nucleoside-diphosphate-sugar epimerase
MSEVAVIGGTGFIGRTLVNRLVEAGHRVRIASRSATQPPGEDPQRVYVRADVADPDSIARLADGVSVLFHLATGGGNAWSDFERDFLQGARNVADACLASGVRRLVYTSSTAALYLGGNETVTDQTPVDPKSGERAFYSRAKAETERLLGELNRTRGLPVVIFRPAIVVGRGGMLTHSGVAYWPNDICALGWSSGNTPLPFVLVDDVAAALLAAVDAPGIDGQTFNLAGDVYLTARDFVRLVRHRSCRDIRFYPQSRLKLQLIEIAKWALKAVARKPGNTFPSYRDLKSRSMCAPFACSAKDKLGWRPNADLSLFIREAIESQIDPIPAGDLRPAAGP